MRTLGVDVSRYQPEVDWGLLYSKGVRFAIIKATQGDYTRDPLLDKHVAGANAAGLTVGLYHWVDPLVSYERQARFFVEATRGLAYRMAAADVEQYWADWAEWTDNRITKFIPPQAISDNAKNVLAYWDDRLTARRVLYTRKTFVDGFARPMLGWMGRYDVWLAQYPYATKPRVTLTWEAFLAGWLPKIAGPDLPEGCKTWKFWQFTGDKFYLPGASTVWDVNYFNGSEDELRIYAGMDVPVPEPEPEEPEEDAVDYSIYPKGVHLTSQQVEPAKLGGDFVAAFMGSGVVTYPLFHRQVQAAADAGKPLIGVYDNDPRIMLDQYESLNMEKWKAEIVGNRVMKEGLLPAIQSGGVNRRIHAVIVTMNKIMETPTKQFDVDWIIQTALAAAYGIWTLCGLPVYLSMDVDVAKKLPHGAKSALTTFFSTLNGGTPGLMAGMATFFNTTVGAGRTWSDVPAPVDGAWEKFSAARLESGLGNAPRTSLWCYSAGTVQMEGVSGVAPLWMYLGSKAQLYKEIGFGGEPEEPEDPEDTEEPTPVSEEVLLLRRIAAAVEKIAGVIK